jgi:hypothetical protein
MGQTATGHYDSISGSGMAPGAGPNRTLQTTSTPGAGTDEVQTLTIGGTPTGGTFNLRFENNITGAIAWSATTNTLLANIQAELDLLPNLGVNGCVASDSSLVSGIGDLLLTFGVIRAKEAVETITVFSNSLTGSAPTLAIAETTPGVTADFRGWPKGQVVRDITNGLLYINTGTTYAPTWTKVGLQS